MDYDNSILLREERLSVRWLIRGTKIIHGAADGTVRPGDLLILLPGTYRIEEFDCRELCFRYTLEEARELAEKAGAQEEVPLPGRSAVERANGIVSAFFSWFQKYRDEPAVSGNRLETAIEEYAKRELFCLLLRFSSPAVRGLLAGKKENRVEQVLRESVFENRTVEELAARCGMKPTAFKNRVKALFGIPPHRWIIARRLERGADLLRTTGLGVERIAEELNFRHPGHFIRLFRREYGQTPLAFRKSAAGKE